MDNYERLLMLFSLHEKAMGHPKYSAMMPKIAGEIDAVVNRINDRSGIAPAAKPAVAEVEWTESNPEPAPTDSELSLRRL